MKSLKKTVIHLGKRHKKKLNLLEIIFARFAISPILLEFWEFSCLLIHFYIQKCIEECVYLILHFLKEMHNKQNAKSSKGTRHPFDIDISYIFHGNGVNLRYLGLSFSFLLTQQSLFARPNYRKKFIFILDTVFLALSSSDCSISHCDCCGKRCESCQKRNTQNIS